MQSKLLFPFLLLSLLSSAATSSPPSAPSPLPDCSTLVISMVDCLSYVSSNSSAIKKPQGQCCSGLKEVLKSNPSCLCEAFKNSAQLGLSINLTKALGLPKACHVATDPKIGDCGASVGTAPAMSPKGTVSPSKAPSAPAVVAGSTLAAPAPSPKKNSASGLIATSAISVLGLAVVLLSFT